MAITYSEVLVESRDCLQGDTVPLKFTEKEKSDILCTVDICNSVLPIINSCRQYL